MIVVDGLCKRFGDLVAVDRVSFHIAAGEMFALVGPNGAGKSTTIHMLTTMLRPTSGSIRIDGWDPLANPLEVRSRLGVVFQDSSLDGELTASENLQLHAVLYHMPRMIRGGRIAQVLNLFDLWDRRDVRVKKLSGGTRRRLEIAKAVLHAPKVLLLDEPTSGLDPQHRHHLWTYVKELNKADGVTVLLTTHYLEEVERVAERVAVIDHGRIVVHGSPQELRRQTGTDSLEHAFLALTGANVRDASASAPDSIRRVVSMWRR